MTPGSHSDGFIIGICCAGREERREGKAGGREMWIVILCDELAPAREYLYTHRSSVLLETIPSTITVSGKDKNNRNTSPLCKVSTGSLE